MQSSELRQGVWAQPAWSYQLFKDRSGCWSGWDSSNPQPDPTLQSGTLPSKTSYYWHCSANKCTIHGHLAPTIINLSHYLFLSLCRLNLLSHWQVRMVAETENSRLVTLWGAIWDNIVIHFILVLINIFVSLHNIFMPNKSIFLPLQI